MNHRTYLLFYIWIIGLTGLTSCGSKSFVLSSEEQIILPEAYEGPLTDTLSAAVVPWEVFFPDTILQNYIALALENNHSFRQAVERINQASAILKKRRGGLFPEVDFHIQSGITRFGEYTMDGVGNRETNVPSLPKDKHIPDPYRNFGLGIGFSWEADIWGKLSNKKRAAYARWLSSVEATRLAQTALITELATHYFELIALDRRSEILKNTIESADKFVELTTVLKQEGDATQLAVDQFSSRLLNLKGQMYENEQKIQQLELSMAVLMGQLPFQIRRSRFDVLKQLKFPITYGVPVQLLQYRPDIRSAEYELHAAKADVKAAKAAFFPSLILGGNGGVNSFDIGKLFSTPASLVYDLAAGITAPIFKRNEIKSLWEISKSEQRVALSRYHETVIKAYSEVAELIANNDLVKKRIELKEKELFIHQRSIRNANQLFKLYFVDYLEVLSAEEHYLTGALEHIDLVTESCIYQANLYRALGGGYFGKDKE